MGGGGGLKIRLKMPVRKPGTTATGAAASASASGPAAPSSQGSAGAAAAPSAPSPPVFHPPPPAAPAASRQRTLQAQRSASGRPRRSAAAGVANVTRLLAEVSPKDLPVLENDCCVARRGLSHRGFRDSSIAQHTLGPLACQAEAQALKLCSAQLQFAQSWPPRCFTQAGLAHAEVAHFSQT